MDHSYAQRKRAERAQQNTPAAPQPSLDALRTGAAQPTSEQMGRRVDLPDAMRAKMEESFGADLSAVKLYESQAVADAGANAITQGSNIAFAPGMLDFSSFGGRSLLGHEISHVVSQARGEVTGGGLLNDYSLEARADREGAMAAAGQQIAMPTAALSPVSAAAAAGPMQASKEDWAQARAEKQQNAQVDSLLTMLDIKNQDPKNYMHNKDWIAANASHMKARRSEDRWNNKLDSIAKKNGTESRANRGAVGTRLLDSLKARHTDESGYLDYKSYKRDAEMGRNYMTWSDTDLLSRMNVSRWASRYRPYETSNDMAWALGKSAVENQEQHLTDQERAEWARLNADDDAWDEAERMAGRRYAAMDQQLEDDRVDYRDRSPTAGRHFWQDLYEEKDDYEGGTLNWDDIKARLPRSAWDDDDD